MLEKGAAVVRARGFTATGVADIAAAAKAPKGSFYNHFASKEAFAVEILDRYFEGLSPLFEATIDNAKLSGAERLKRLIDGLIEAMSDGSWGGCLLGNFAMDVAPNSELVRNRVNALFAAWEAKLRTAIAAGQSDGSIATDLSPDDAAAWFVTAWEGAVMRSKALRDPAPFHQFRRSALTQFMA